MLLLQNAALRYGRVAGGRAGRPACRRRNLGPAREVHRPGYRDGQGTGADVAGARTLMPASLDEPLGDEGKPVHDLFGRRRTVSPLRPSVSPLGSA